MDPVDPDPPLKSGRTAAWIQEASCAERVVVLKVRIVGSEAPEGNRTAHVVLGHGRAGLVTPEARRAAWGGKLPAFALRQRAREDALVGAELLALGEAEAFVDQRGMPRVVRATPAGRVVVTDERPAAGSPPFALLGPETRRELEERGARLVAAIADDALDLRRAEATKTLDRAAARIGRRREAVRGDLGKIAQADAIAAQAQWLVAAAAKAPRGATSLVVTDWSTGEARPLEVPLDPSKSAKDQVAAMFKRAKRLRLGARIAEERLAQAESQLLAVEIAKEEAAKAPSLPALEAVLRDAKKSAPRDVSLPSGGGSSSAGAGGRSAKAGPPRRSAYRTFFAGSGRKLLVGKGAADNDELTLHVARPHDTWVHAKDRTGAHVIVPLDKGRTCAGEDLVDAAHLAAHFSDARDEAVVDVQYTDRRYLRKPKGSPPGFILVDREKVLVLRVEPPRLRALLEREET
jgi:hypothetical protein